MTSAANHPRVETAFQEWRKKFEISQPSMIRLCRAAFLGGYEAANVEPQDFPKVTILIDGVTCAVTPVDPKN